MDTESVLPHSFSETILLVDDDAIFRGFCHATLQHLGYTVCVASDGAEGLNILERERGRIRLVILDLLLPGISGRELYDRIREIDSDIRVIIASGLDFDAARDIFDGLDLSWYIMKPFSIHSLSRAVRNALDSGSAP